MSDDRDLLSAWLREPIPPAVPPTPALADAARNERVHLLLAHRFGLAISPTTYGPRRPSTSRASASCVPR